MVRADVERSRCKAEHRRALKNRNRHAQQTNCERRYLVFDRTGHPVGTGEGLDFSVATPLLPGEDSTFGKILRWYRGSTRCPQESHPFPGDTVKVRAKSRDSLVPTHVSDGAATRPRPKTDCRARRARRRVLGTGHFARRARSRVLGAGCCAYRAPRRVLGPGCFALPSLRCHQD